MILPLNNVIRNNRSFRCSEEMARLLLGLLLDHGAFMHTPEMDENHRQKYPTLWPALHYAIHWGGKTTIIVQFLLDREADLN